MERNRPRILEWLASLRELQSATGEELSALLPSVLDKSNLGKENIIRNI
jgi:hypothetical protein